MKPHNLVFASLLAVAAFPCAAAPFLVCDPYPATDPQPSSFLVTVGTAAPVEVPATKNPDGSVILKWDLATVGTGAKVVKARAKSVWGESVDTAPFSFTAGMPIPPGNIGLSAK